MSNIPIGAQILALVEPETPALAKIADQFLDQSIQTLKVSGRKLAQETKTAFGYGPKDYARRPLKGVVIKKDTYAKIEVEDTTTMQVVKGAITDSGFIRSDGMDHPHEADFASNFVLQSVEESKSEKFQLVETFGDSYVFFFGSKPTVYRFSAVLFNTEDFNWKQEFWYNYDQLFRGTKLAYSRYRVKLTFDNTVVHGYFIGGADRTSADSDKSLPVQFEILVSSVDIIGDFTSQTIFSKSPSIDLKAIAEAQPSTTYVSNTFVTRQINEQYGTMGTPSVLGQMLAWYSSASNKAKMFIENMARTMYGRTLRVPREYFGGNQFNSALPTPNLSFPLASGSGTFLSSKNALGGPTTMYDQLRRAFGPALAAKFVGMGLSQPSVRAVSKVVNPGKTSTVYQDLDEYLFGGDSMGSLISAQNKLATYRLGRSDLEKRKLTIDANQNRLMARTKVEAWMASQGVISTPYSPTADLVSKLAGGAIAYGMSFLLATTSDSKAVTTGEIDRSKTVTVRDPRDPTKTMTVGFGRFLDVVESYGISTAGTTGAYNTVGLGNRLMKGMDQDWFRGRVRRDDGTGGQSGVFWVKKKNVLEWSGPSSTFIGPDGEPYKAVDVSARGRFVDENGNPNPNYPPNPGEKYDVDVTSFYSNRRYVGVPAGLERVPEFADMPDVYVPEYLRHERATGNESTRYIPQAARGNRYEGVGLDGRWGDRVWTPGYIPTVGQNEAYTGQGKDGYYGDNRYIMGYVPVAERGKKEKTR